MVKLNLNENPRLFKLSKNGASILQLDSKGGAFKISQKSIATISEPFWIHLDLQNSNCIDWIKLTTILPKIVKEDFLDTNAVSKEIRFDYGLLVIVKLINILDVCKSEVRNFKFYIAGNFIISASMKDNSIYEKLRDNFKNEIGPKDVAHWLTLVSELILDKIEISFDILHDKIIKLEDDIFNEECKSFKEINLVRKQLIELRRVLMPQRDIFTRISTEKISWIDENDRKNLANLSSELASDIADIDSCLLRLAYLMELVSSNLAESTNKRIYLMTLFTMIFMPMTFLASLLGVNLEGIPFASANWSFAGFCILVVVIGIVFAIWLKFKKWM